MQDRVDYLIAVQSQFKDIRRMAAKVDSVRRASFLYALADDLEKETRAEDLAHCSPE